VLKHLFFALQKQKKALRSSAKKRKRKPPKTAKTVLKKSITKKRNGFLSKTGFKN